MKTTLIFTALAGLVVFSSCKKERTCECKNANGTYTAGQIDATKSQAKSYCKDLSTSATDCYLK